MLRLEDMPPHIRDRVSPDLSNPNWPKATIDFDLDVMQRSDGLQVAELRSQLPPEEFRALAGVQEPLQLGDNRATQLIDAPPLTEDPDA